MKDKKITDQLMVSSIILVIASLFLFGFAYYLWQKNIARNPEKLFWSAMDQALGTSGFTRTVNQKGDTQDFMQVIKLRYAGTLQSEATITATELSTDSRVVTETLGFPNADYLKYRELQAPSKELNNEVKDRWAKLPQSENGQSQFLADALLNTALFTANFDHKNRREFLNFLRESKVYSVDNIIDYDRDIDGRKATVLSVTINPTSYTLAMKRYLELLGLTKIAESFASDLPSTEDVYAEVAIHPASRQFVRFGIPTVEAPSAERFTGWGAYEATEIPEQTIGYELLESQLFKAEN